MRGTRLVVSCLPSTPFVALPAVMPGGTRHDRTPAGHRGRSCVTAERDFVGPFPAGTFSRSRCPLLLLTRYAELLALSSASSSPSRVGASRG